MATDISAAAVDIMDRLLIGGTAQEPTEAMLATWLRAAFKEQIGNLKPVVRAVLPVTRWEADLVADQVFYVSDGLRTLFRDIEWGDDGQKVYLDTSINPDQITAWYFTDPGITASTDSVNTSCIFGGDWLEEIAKTMAMAQAYERIAGTAADQNEAQAASMLRVEWADKVERMYKWKRGEWDNWQSRMEQGMQRRAAMGDLPVRSTPYSNFVNKSSLRNPLTGVRTGA